MNCWNSLKLFMLQQKDEICLIVNATKVKRNKQMIYG
nr:MAG TPA: hypothetical protein [Caudoviricetes sp.]DAZ23766.1 MAG TPA: hypothetical protein [Caudoviricetes sp.]